MYQSVQIFPAAMQSINSATFTGSYQAFGTGFTYPVRILKIINNSDQNVTLSLDGGATDHDFVVAANYVLYDFGCQRGNDSPAMELAKTTPILIKGTAGTGLVYLVAWCAFTPTMTIPQ